jgi:hypothetical protein
LCPIRQTELIQHQVRYCPPQTGVLGFQFLEPLHLIALQAAILIPPPIVRYFRHAYRSDRISNQPALRHQHINLP